MEKSQDVMIGSLIYEIMAGLVLIFFGIVGLMLSHREESLLGLVFCILAIVLPVYIIGAEYLKMKRQRKF